MRDNTFEKWAELNYDSNFRRSEDVILKSADSSDFTFI